jgi:hypothetical protein
VWLSIPAFAPDDLKSRFKQTHSHYLLNIGTILAHFEIVMNVIGATDYDPWKGEDIGFLSDAP